ncbi:retrotransposon protein, putative, ty1-copia subclass [Tanacetum coccineum]
MDMLQREGILQPTYNESHEKCKSYISGKMARKPFPYQVERAKDLLGLIHTDVCGPFRVLSREGANYFITFTNDFSHYGFVYLMKHKHEVFETFKVAFRHLRDAFSVVFGLSLTQDTVMSDSEDSTVTYTTVSSSFVDLPDIGSSGVDGPHVMPEDPYAYVVAAFQAPPSPDYLPVSEYPPSSDLFKAAEEQPLPDAVSPTVDSPGYVPESNPREDPEEDDDEDLEEDPTDYPADGGDDGDDEDESSNDDEDDDVDIEGDEEEEEHPAPADSKAIDLPAIEHAPSTEETEPFETD